MEGKLITKLGELGNIDYQGTIDLLKEQLVRSDLEVERIGIERDFYRDRIHEKMGFKQASPEMNPPKEQENIQFGGLVSPAKMASYLERKHRILAANLKREENAKKVAASADVNPS